MKKGKYLTPRNAKRTNKKLVSLMLALALTIGGVVGGTIAWLTDQTKEVKNTFTVGNIDIDLTETTGEEYKMVPGNIITKDPKVTVEAGSEDCWVFIKVNESDVLNQYIKYEIDPNNWTQLVDKNNQEVKGVYYTKYTNRDDVDIDIKVLLNNQVTVLDTVTKQMMDGLKVVGATQPTLTFTAYAVQMANVNSAADAWELANSATSGT